MFGGGRLRGESSSKIRDLSWPRSRRRSQDSSPLGLDRQSFESEINQYLRGQPVKEDHSSPLQQDGHVSECSREVTAAQRQSGYSCMEKVVSGDIHCKGSGDTPRFTGNLLMQPEERRQETNMSKDTGQCQSWRQGDLLGNRHRRTSWSVVVLKGENRGGPVFREQEAHGEDDTRDHRKTERHFFF